MQFLNIRDSGEEGLLVLLECANNAVFVLLHSEVLNKMFSILTKLY